LAGYDITAAKLKPLVEKQNFTSDQLTVINRMLRGCWALRSGDLCTKFLTLMIDEKFKIVEDELNPIEFDTKYGKKTFYPQYVLDENETLDDKRPKKEADPTDEKIKAAMEKGIIE
jgi:hypothetical protein